MDPDQDEIDMGIVETIAAGVMAIGWGFVYVLLGLFFIIVNPFKFGFLIKIPNHAYQMARMSLGKKPDESKGLLDGQGRKRNGCFSVLFFPLWFPFSCVMGTGHLFFSVLLAVLIDFGGAKRQFMLAEESFRF